MSRCGEIVRLPCKRKHHRFTSRGNDPCLPSFLQFARRGGSASFRSSPLQKNGSGMTFIAGVFLAFIAFAVAATLVIFAIGPIMVLNPRRRGEAFYKERGEP